MVCSSAKPDQEGSDLTESLQNARCAESLGLLSVHRMPITAFMVWLEAKTSRGSSLGSSAGGNGGKNVSHMRSYEKRKTLTNSVSKG